MKSGAVRRFFDSVVVGNRYSTLDGGQQVSYATISSFFLLLIIPLTIVATTYVGVFTYRLYIKSFMILSCAASVFLLRTTKVPHKYIPIFPVFFCGLYWLYLLYTGELDLWISIWLLAFPPTAILLCGLTVGLVQTIFVFITILLFKFTPLSPIAPDPLISLRYILFYLFITGVVIVTQRLRTLSERTLRTLNSELAQEKNIIRTMEDNIPHGVFRMDKELKILPLYSKPLISILSYYDSDLAGKNFLDVLSSSLSGPQLKILRGYFSMVFDKSKTIKVLESANPIGEFEYKVDDRVKILSTRFRLVESEDSEPVIVCVIQDVSREKEFERELQAQKDAQELEMKKIFEVIQVDPVVFQDFIEDAENDFNVINTTLKDKDISEKEAVTRFFQNVHSIKANALILGLETFGEKLHSLEENIKVVSAKKEISQSDILSLAIRLDSIMQEKDSHLAMVKKIENYKSSHLVDAVLIGSLKKAIERSALSTGKIVELVHGTVDMQVLESPLRKPIKDILLQLIRNSIYHGIETQDERARKKKNPRGLLSYSIKSIDDKVEVMFSDDGGGFDWEKIKRKYLKMHPGVQDVSRNTLLKVVFTPEFSTADTVTTAAGQGVGLSLVKDLVKSYNGTINVSSSDSGLTFRFLFPTPHAA